LVELQADPPAKIADGFLKFPRSRIETCDALCKYC